MRSLLVIFVLVFLLSGVALAKSNLALAQETTGTSSQPQANPLGFAANVYRLAFMFGGFLAFGAIVFGGIKYTLAAGNPSGQSDAKEWITNALLGLVLLLGAYLVLNTISPGLTQIGLPGLTKLKPVTEGQTSGGGVGFLGSVQLSHIQAAFLLREAGIGFQGTLEGIRQSTIDELKGLKGSCAARMRTNCDVFITSATGGQHAAGICSHASGYKADLRLNSTLDRYITENYTSIGFRRSDRAALYRSPNGAVYARESDHWDMRRC